MRIELGHQRESRASVPDVEPVASDLAHKVCQLIQQEMQAVGLDYTAINPHSSPRPEDVERLKRARMAVLMRGLRWPIPMLDNALRTAAAKRAFRFAKMNLRSGLMTDARGAFDPSNVREPTLYLTITNRHFMQDYGSNFNQIHATLTHELRHAVDWVYTHAIPASKDNKVNTYWFAKRHPAKHGEFEPDTESYWRAYMANPTEQLAWAGNIAQHFDDYPTTAEMMKKINMPMWVLDDKQWAAHVEQAKKEVASNVRKGPLDLDKLKTELPPKSVPLLDLIPSHARRKFIEMVTKALDLRFRKTEDKPRKTRLELAREDKAVRRQDAELAAKVPTQVVHLIAKYVWIKHFDGRDVKLSKDEFGRTVDAEGSRRYKTYADFLRGESADSIALVAENDSDLYKNTLSKLPTNSRGEYPDLRSLIKDRLQTAKT